MNIKTKFQLATEAREMLQKLEDMIDTLEINCVSCFDWDSDKEFCKKYNARPPTTVIVVGCKDYDNIPF